MSRRLLVLGVALVVSVSGCGSIFGSDQSVILGVSAIDAPATIAPGSSLSVTLTVVRNGCEGFDRIEIDRLATGANVTVWGKDASIGNKNIGCPSRIWEEPRTIVFNPPFASTFTIAVDRGRLAPLSRTVEVR
jgi:hypothetical protein